MDIAIIGAGAIGGEVTPQGTKGPGPKWAWRVPVSALSAQPPLII